MFSKYVLFKKGHVNKRAGVWTPWTPPGSATGQREHASPRHHTHAVRVASGRREDWTGRCRRVVGSGTCPSKLTKVPLALVNPGPI